MTAFAIMRAPGPRAERSRRASRSWRRMGLVEARNQKEALERFVHLTYVGACHAQYRSHSLVWVSAGALRELWNRDDHIAGRDRRWRLLVTLGNGQALHDVSLEAWKQ